MQHGISSANITPPNPIRGKNIMENSKQNIGCNERKWQIIKTRRQNSGASNMNADINIEKRQIVASFNKLSWSPK